jgi:hypothetical protein
MWITKSKHWVFCETVHTPPLSYPQLGSAGKCYINPDPMIIEHEGLDGAGKSAGMALDIYAAWKRERKSRNPRQIWAIGSFKYARQLRHPLQLIYLSNSICFLDELQRWYPSDNSQIDEVTMHIVSTHRHEKNIIHWSSQDHFFVHPYWRRETRYVWQYRSIWPDLITGDSKIGLHKRQLITAVDRELKRRKPKVIKKGHFWINKHTKSLFNTYEKLDVVAEDPKTKDILAKITDPRGADEKDNIIMQLYKDAPVIGASSPDVLVNPLGDSEEEQFRFPERPEPEDDEELIER